MTPIGTGMQRRFQQVDVFASAPLSGNPLAVVVDAEGLSTAEMQRFARWTNLSEAAFLLPPTAPDADYRVRIFTLARELPFAGHPTIGACHAWLAAGGHPASEDLIVQQCGAGNVAIRHAGGRLAFAAPPTVREGPVDDDLVEQLSKGLRVSRDEVVDAHWVDNGPGWVALLLESADAVLAVEPDFPRGDRLDVGVVGRHPPGAGYAIEVRAFFTDERGTLKEDPVTGSLNASVAQWLLSTGYLTAPYVAGQGTRLGRHGRVHIDRDDDGNVWVGGDAHTCVVGHVDLQA